MQYSPSISPILTPPEKKELHTFFMCNINFFFFYATYKLMLVVLVLFLAVTRDMFLIVVYRGEREGVGTTTLLPVYLNVQARTYFLFLRIYGQNNSKNMGKLCMKEHESIDSLKCCFRFYLLLQKQDII